MLAVAVVALHAQQNTPHAGYVYPAGGRAGETVEVTVGGQFLDGVNGVLISGGGVQASVVDYVKPLTQGQFNKLRDQLQELMDKKKAGTPAWTLEDEKTAADLRMKIATFVRRPMTPAIAENVKLQVKLDAGASLGDRQLRLVTANGVTNPLVFCVGQLPEISKEAAKVQSELPRKTGAKKRAQPSPPGVEETEVSLPAIINGQITPGGVDRYRLQATKGQHLVIAANVRELIPYISDAVPGWFQAAVGLYDASGKELTYADHYTFHQDPVLYYEIPADGVYTLAIHDSIYRGREDFVYRIAVGELPYISSIFPLGGRIGTRTNIEVKGWNLPANRLTQDAKGRTPGVYPVSISKGDFTSNRMPFAVDNYPEALEHEPNNTAATAQRVKLPLIVNGRIDKPGDMDVFRLEGKAGEEVVAEVIARRLDSPLDSILRLTDAKGKQIAGNDDYEDKGAGLLTFQADSYIRVKLPASGTYYLYLTDTQHKGGADFAYRLRLSNPQPDYQLRITPSSVSAKAGATIPLTVYALRKDGFDGEIQLKLKDAPGGFVLSGGWIPAGKSSERLTLTVPSRKMNGPVELHLEGTAQLDRHEVRRPAVPAEDMMQAFAYHHIVAEDAWFVRVGGNAKARGWKLMTDKVVQLPEDGVAQARVFLPLGRYATDVQLELIDPPDGISIQKVGLFDNGVILFLRADHTKAKPGLAGNLIVDAYIDIQTKKQRTTLGTLPAIPFEVVSTAQAQR